MGAGSPEELIGKPISEIVHPENWSDSRNRIKRMLKGEKGLYPVENRYVRVDGKTIDVDVIASALMYDGKPAVQVAVQDITEKKATDKSLRETEASLRMAVEAANIGLWSWDLKTDKVNYSAEWKRQIGYGEDEISDDFSEWRNRVHPDDLERSLNTVNRFIHNPLAGL